MKINLYTILFILFTVCYKGYKESDLLFRAMETESQIAVYVLHNQD